MDMHTACEMAHRNGMAHVVKDVKAYILAAIDEWNGLGDRKYDLPNVQVYNHLHKCLDDLETYEKTHRLME